MLQALPYLASRWQGFAPRTQCLALLKIRADTLNRSRRRARHGGRSRHRFRRQPRREAREPRPFALAQKRLSRRGNYD